VTCLSTSSSRGCSCISRFTSFEHKEFCRMFKCTISKATEIVEQMMYSIWKGMLSEKQVVTQPLSKFPAPRKLRSLITVFTISCKFSYPKPVESSPQLTCLILHLFFFAFPRNKRIFPSDFTSKIVFAFHLSLICFITRQFSPQYLISQFASYLLSLKSNIFPSTMFPNSRNFNKTHFQ
jgi:hypothetical protein